MSNLELKNISNRIEQLQDVIDIAYENHDDKELRFDIVKESYTYLRFLITSFKLDLFDSLKSIDEDLPLKLYNIYLMHYLPSSSSENDGDFSMRFYFTADQIKRTEKILDKDEARKFRTDIYASDSKCGLARLSMLLSSREEGIENFDIYTWNNWQKHKIYKHPNEYTNYTEIYDLTEELHIYGMEEEHASTMIVGVAPEGAEIFLLFNDIINHKIIGKVTQILSLAYENLLKIVSKKYMLLFFDQIIWEIINIKKETITKINDKNKDKGIANIIDYEILSKYPNIIEELWKQIKCGIENGDYFKYLEKIGKDVFKEFSTKHLDLWKIFKTFIQEEDETIFWEHIALDDKMYGSHRCMAAKYADMCKWLLPKEKSSELYEINVKNIDSIKKRKDNWFKKKLFKDLGIKYMASHDKYHIRNICRLALEIIAFLKGLDINQEHLAHFITSIHLHDLGMAVYFKEIISKISATLEPSELLEIPLMRTRKYHSISTSLELYNENSSKWKLIAPVELKNVSILSAFHSKKTPLLKGDKTDFEYFEEFKSIEYLFHINGSNEMHSLEKMKEIQDNNFPYFLFVSLLRIIDCIDIQDNRSLKLGREKLKNILSVNNELLDVQPLHIMKHAAFANCILEDCILEESKESRLFEWDIFYAPEIFLPLAIVIHGFASAVDEINKELKKINRRGVIDEIKKELQPIDSKAFNEFKNFKINAHLWGFSDAFDKDLFTQFERLFDV